MVSASSGNGYLRSLAEKWIEDLQNVYVRIGKTDYGVGVIAIRDIPEGVDPFLGDTSELMPIGKTVIEKVKDESLARMINDFCPCKKGVYLVPKDGFNSIGVGWYINHSDTPNMKAPCDGSLNFVTSRFIKAGEELTIDYNTYDDQKEEWPEEWHA